MPVTAGLSQKFYEKLGDDLANELVDWFNQVDATYRADLRELNEANFGRFDGKLGERLAELRADFDGRFARFDATWAERLAELRGKLEQRVTELRAEMDSRLTKLEAQLDTRLDRLKSELLRWMFGFWVSTLIGLGALFFRG